MALRGSLYKTIPRFSIVLFMNAGYTRFTGLSCDSDLLRDVNLSPILGKLFVGVRNEEPIYVSSLRPSVLHISKFLICLYFKCLARRVKHQFIK